MTAEPTQAQFSILRIKRRRTDQPAVDALCTLLSFRCPSTSNFSTYPPSLSCAVIETPEQPKKRRRADKGEDGSAAEDKAPEGASSASAPAGASRGTPAGTLSPSRYTDHALSGQVSSGSPKPFPSILSPRPQRLATSRYLSLRHLLTYAAILTSPRS